MSDLLKNAFNYLGTAGNSAETDVVGCDCKVGTFNVRIKKLIAEGWSFM